MAMTDDATTYIHIADAAELTGYSVVHLRKLVRSGQIAHRDSGGTLAIAWPDVQGLAKYNRSASWVLPNSALQAEMPPPGLLLYTAGHGGGNCLAESYFRGVKSGHCLEWMRQMPAGIVQSVVTSPPYWGKRAYNSMVGGVQRAVWADGSCVRLGEEATVEDYVAHSLEVLRHLKRVLRGDGTVWWNIGDTYQTRTRLRSSGTERLAAIEGGRRDVWREYPHKRYSSGHPYLKDKDLTLIPFLVAWGAQHIGFYVRSVVIWQKDNASVDPAADRPAVTHEYIVLLAKSRFYKYRRGGETEASVTGKAAGRGDSGGAVVAVRNLRTVWEFPPGRKLRRGSHPAVFPLELPLRCLRLTTDPGDLVFDPFIGSGTTLLAAKLLGRAFFGCDVDPAYVEIAREELAQTEGY
jgi:DNA modification methylase